MTDHREYAAQRAVSDVQRCHRAHVEPQARIGLAGQPDHRGRGIDATRRQPQLMHMGGDVAGSTPQVRDLTVPTRTDGLGEGAQDGAVQGLSRSVSRNSCA